MPTKRLALFFAALGLAAGATLGASRASAAPPNLGGPEPTIRSENVITFPGPKVDGGVPNVLYAPAQPDDPAYRAAIAGVTGGVVDYFNATAATPTLALLQNYDVVYTWSNSPYFDRVAMGNALADYVDGGGRVVLGVFCTFTSGNSLGGRIMNSDYCPVVSPLGTNHFSSSNYSGNGTSYQHRNVLFYTDTIRDVLVVQGLGVLDGRWNDGEIATAHRPDGRVMYMNAVGSPGGGAGDQPRIVANFALWTFPGGSFFAATAAGGLYGINLRTGKATFVGNLPQSPVAEIEFDATTGIAYCSAGPFGNRLQPFAIGTGAALGAQVATPYGTYSAMESIFGSWFGCYHLFSCGPSSTANFNPTSGVINSGPFANGVGPIAGMSFNATLGRMYYVTDVEGGVCAGQSELYWNTAPGAPFNGLGGVGFQAGAIEWGPDDNLYGVNTGANSQLYRINPTTGISSVIGLTGVGGMTGLTLVSGNLTVDAGAWGGAGSSGLALAAPIPNPSALLGRVTIRYSLAREGATRVAIHDVAGRRVWSHDEVRLDAGEHTLVWDGRSDNGELAPAGIYFVKLVTEGGERSGKLVRF